MKIRKGFVSNSSSSSFVVVFPYRPSSVQEVKKMLFEEEELHYVGIPGYPADDDYAPTLPIAKKVFDRCLHNAPWMDIFEAVRNGWFSEYKNGIDIMPGHYDMYDTPEWEQLHDLKHGSDEWTKLYDEISKKAHHENNKRAKAIHDAFMKEHDGKHIAVIWFSDNDGEAVEEHGNIFKRLPHIRTSYH